MRAVRFHGAKDIRVEDVAEPSGKLLPDDVLIAPSTFGAGLDPSTRKRDRNAAQFGTGKWARVLIDAMAGGGAEAKRAFAAMMEMGKIDIAKIEAARRG